MIKYLYSPVSLCKLYHIDIPVTKKMKNYIDKGICFEYPFGK